MNSPNRLLLKKFRYHFTRTGENIWGSRRSHLSLLESAETIDLPIPLPTNHTPPPHRGAKHTNTIFVHTCVLPSLMGATWVIYCLIFIGFGPKWTVPVLDAFIHFPFFFF